MGPWQVATQAIDGTSGSDAGDDSKGLMSSPAFLSVVTAAARWRAAACVSRRWCCGATERPCGGRPWGHGNSGAMAILCVCILNYTNKNIHALVMGQWGHIGAKESHGD